MSPRKLAEKTFNFTAAAQPADLTSTTVDCSNGPMQSFALQAKATGWTAWSLKLEGTLDGVNWDTLLTHDATTPTDGKIIYSTTKKPVKKLRMNLASASGGSSGQALSATFLAIPS